MKEFIGPILTKDAEEHYKEIDRAILIAFISGAFLSFAVYLSHLGRELLPSFFFGLSCYFFIKARYHGLKRLFGMGGENEK